MRSEKQTTEQPIAGCLPAVISASSPLANSLELEATPEIPGPQKLSLRKLEAFPRALLPVLLPFLHTGIARQKSVLPQSRPQLPIKSRDRSRQSHAHRSSLPTNAAAMRRHLHIHLIR